MRDVRNAADQLEKSLRAKGSDKYYLAVTESETREFNAENGEFSLYRTVIGGTAAAKVFSEGRTGTASGNDLSDEGLDKLAGEACASASSADPDPAWDIAPDEGKDLFRQGVYEPDMEKFFDRVSGLLADVAREYPQIRVMAAIADHRRAHSIYRNTNGTEFEEFTGAYDFMIEFSAMEGDRSTSINFCGITLTDLDTPFIDQGLTRKRLEDSIASLDAKPLEGKFTGTAVFTPDCLGDFISMLMGNYCADSVILDGTSLWKDRVGEKVAADCVNIGFSTSDPRVVTGSLYTTEGFRSEDLSFIEGGVLKTHLLSLYAANKTGRPVTKSALSGMYMTPGEKSLEEIIAGIDRGLLVGGFSGGQPGTNGEFSGVAKNSFLIEGGKIAGAVTETMINGNLGAVFATAFAVSREVGCDGSTVLPYMAASGVIISGK